MSKFEVLVEEIVSVTDHPDADKLSIVQIRGFHCVSGKLEDGSHRYKVGDLVVYVPEGAVVPDYLLRDGYWNAEKGQGILAGSKGNRVKALKLRGFVSQGIIFPVLTAFSTHVAEWYIPAKVTVEDRKDFKGDPGTGHASLRFEALSSPHVPIVGTDVSEILGIKKYEPEIPSSMSGEVEAMFEHANKYDIENIQKYTDIFEDGETVTIREKIHGTNVRFIVTEDYIGVTSKGLGAQGLVFKQNKANVGNVYVRMMNEYLPVLKEIQSKCEGGRTLYIYGEIYGKGIQDLHYDATDKPKLVVFDVIWEGVYLSNYNLEMFTTSYGFKMPPLLYSGPYSKEVVDKHTSGVSQLSGGIKEGCVVKPVVESSDPAIGRKFLKSVSQDYLLRKGGGTEYQ